jgi:hypothetical protein
MQQLLLEQRAAFDESGTARLSESGIDRDLTHRHADLAQTPQESHFTRTRIVTAGTAQIPSSARPCIRLEAACKPSGDSAHPID